MTWRVLCGDCLTEMAKMEAGSFHCCVTSPPYSILDFQPYCGII
jgi:DNA modification methylase